MLIADVNGGAGIFGFSYVGKRKARDEINAANRAAGLPTYDPVLTIGTSAGAIQSFVDGCGATTEQMEALIPTIDWAKADPTRGFLKTLGVVGKVVAFGWVLVRGGLLSSDVLTENIRKIGDDFGVRTFRDLEAKHAAGAPEFHCFVFDCTTGTGFTVPDDITDQFGFPRESVRGADGSIVTRGWLDMDVADFVAASACAVPGFKPKFIKDANGVAHKLTDGGAWASLPMQAGDEVVEDWMTRHPGAAEPLVIGATPFGLPGGPPSAPPSGVEGFLYRVLPGLQTLLQISQAGNATENENLRKPEVRGRVAVFNTTNVQQDALDLAVSLATQKVLEADGYAGFKAWDAGRRARGLAPYSTPAAPPSAGLEVA